MKQLIKENLCHGDVLHCSSNGILGRCIKFLTRSKINHSALVIKIDDEVFICDSQKNGTNLKTLENWVKAYNYDYKIHRYKFNNPIWGRKIRIRALSKIGVTGYDFTSLVFWQPLYLLTGKWFGRTKEKAEKRMYCSEFVAWVHSIGFWWEENPDSLFKTLDQLGTFDLIE